MKKLILILLPMLTLLMLLSIILSRITNKTKIIKLNWDIKTMVHKAKSDKGFVIFNDSIVVSQNCYLFNDKKQQIKSISPPFYLEKKKKSDSILILKKNDSLYFKLILIN